MKPNQLAAILLFCMTVIPGVAEQTQEPAKQPFTFIQICDPQLGKGGYEHDLKTFCRLPLKRHRSKLEFGAVLAKG